MSSSSVEYWVFLVDVLPRYFCLKSEVNVDGNVNDLIDTVLNEKKKKISDHFKTDVDASEVEVYYEGPTEGISTDKWKLLKHSSLLSSVTTTLPTAYFRMEIQQLCPADGM